MAFFGRVGNILRQAINKQMRSQLSLTPSAFQAIRCMSSATSSKVFVGGISFSIDEQDLREAFANYGEVVDARVITDRDTGRSKGFGFGSSAIQALDGQDLHGRRVRVNFATDKPRGFGGANGYGSGAGYGGSYGNAPYGGSGRSSNYSNAGAYGGGSYRGGGNVGGSRFGNNSAYDSFQTRTAGPASSDNFGNIGGGNTNFSSSEGLDSREDDNLGENGGHEVESVDDEDDGADNLAKKA